MRKTNRNLTIGSLIGRVLLTAMVLAIAAFFTPGFTISGLTTLLLSAAIIIALNFAAESLTGIGTKPFGRGLAGFAITVIVLLVTSKILPGFNIGLFSAVLGALFIGIVDAVLPGKAF